MDKEEIIPDSDQPRDAFTSMAAFRAHYFPNMVEKEREPKRVIVIIPRPGV